MKLPAFIQRKLAQPSDKVIDKITEKVEKKYGDKALKVAAIAARASIRIYGIPEARVRQIKAIQQDFARTYKTKGVQGIDEMIINAKNTPEYGLLLNDLQLTWDNVEVLKQEAIKNAQ